MVTSAPSEKAKAAITTRILVWDAPVRLSHWLMVVCFIGAYWSAGDDGLRPLHITAGYTLAILVAFRVFWGMIGTRYALFKNFVRGPGAVMGYLRSLRTSTPEQYVGHNPAGAVAILALLGLTVVVTALGWATNQQGASEWLEEAHELAANMMLAVVIVHIMGVLVGSWLHHESLIGAMFTGRKFAGADQSIERSMWLVALILAALLAEFWWFQWAAENR
jgi:cytochrome b